MKKIRAQTQNTAEINRVKYETELLSEGIEYIAGVDEVGRGALAGPMVVASVILSPKHLKALANLSVKQNTTINNDIPTEILEQYAQIRDSKLLVSTKREALSLFIKSIALSYSIEIIDNTIIDKIGISKCTQMGFFNAISKLTVKVQHILTDSFPIKVVSKKMQTNIIKGDNKSISIAAASIIAKVYRDNLMINLHNDNREYKPYLFFKNKAYGTREHIEALRKLGPSNMHRKSFEPVKSLLKS